MALANLQALIAQLAPANGGQLSDADRATALAQAVERYSADRPRVLVEDLAVSDGGLGLPEGWQADFSAVSSLEYPIGHRPPSFFRADQWFMYQHPDGWGIELVEDLREGTLVRCAYTVRHVVDADTDTIPAQDAEAVACWAAALLCEQLATLLGANTEPTIQADRVDTGSPARQYAAMAKTYRQRYFDALGIDPKRNVAAGVVVSFPARNSRGQPPLTHPLPVINGNQG